MNDIDAQDLTRGELTRRAILEAAGRLFLSNGFHGTSMRQIAREAGIAVGGIYNHFASKEDIFRALLAVRSPYPLLIDAINEVQGGSGPEMMREAFSRFRGVMDTRLDFVALALIDLREFEGNTLHDLLSEVFPIILQHVAKMRAAGGIRPEFDNVSIMRIFADLIIGHTITTLIGKQLLDSEVAAFVPDMAAVLQDDSIMLEILLNGLQVRE